MATGTYWGSCGLAPGPLFIGDAMVLVLDCCERLIDVWAVGKEVTERDADEKWMQRDVVAGRCGLPRDVIKGPRNLDHVR